MQPGFGSSPHHLLEGLNPSHHTAWTTRRVAQLALICSISRQEQHCVHDIYPAADPECVRAENSPLCFHLHFSTETLWEFRSNQKISTRGSDWLCVFLLHCLAVSFLSPLQDEASLKKPGTSRDLPLKNSKAWTTSNNTQSCCFPSLAAADAEPTLLESDERKDPEAPSNVALPQLIDCQDGDEPRNFGVSCGDDEALCWFSAKHPPVTQAGGKWYYKPHLWRDTIIVYLSLQRDTGATSILGWPNFNLDNVTKRSFVNWWSTTCKHSMKRPPLIHTLDLLSADRAPAVKLSEFERQIHEQRKVTKVVSRSTRVSQERVNLLKTKLSACGTRAFFFWQVNFLGPWVLMFPFLSPFSFHFRYPEYTRLSSSIWTQNSKSKYEKHKSLKACKATRGGHSLLRFICRVLSQSSDDVAIVSQWRLNS